MIDDQNNIQQNNVSKEQSESDSIAQDSQNSANTPPVQVSAQSNSAHTTTFMGNSYQPNRNMLPAIFGFALLGIGLIAWNVAGLFQGKSALTLTLQHPKSSTSAASNLAQTGTQINQNSNATINAPAQGPFSFPSISQATHIEQDNLPQALDFVIIPTASNIVLQKVQYEGSKNGYSVDYSVIGEANDKIDATIIQLLSKNSWNIVYQSKVGSTVELDTQNGIYQMKLVKTANNQSTHITILILEQ